MRLYLEVLKKAFQENYMYRTNSYLSIISTCLSVFIMISVWDALYQGRESVNQASLYDLINFVIISVFLNSFTRSDMGKKVARKVADGTITNDFIRPVNFKYFMFADTMGANLFRAVFQTLPIILLACLFWKIHIPGFTNLVLFLISFFLGVLIIFYIHFIVGLFSFWNHNANLTFMIYFTAVELFGGTFVPLWFYPEWLYKIATLFPFHLVYFQPINIYLEKISYSGAMEIIWAQLVWFLVLFLFEKLMWRFASNRIEILGG